MSEMMPAAMPKVDARLRLAERLLNGFGLGTCAVSLAAWAAHALGWLPAVLEPFRIPVLALGSAAFVLGAAFPALRQLFAARRLPWTRAAGAVAAAGLVLVQAGIVARAWSEDVVGLPILGAWVLLGSGLLVDAAAAIRSRSLPPLAIAGVVSAGFGVLLLAVPLESHQQASMLAATALLAFAGVVYFRVRSRLPAHAGEGETIQRMVGN